MSLKLLVNENFPAPSVARLRDSGYDVLAIAERKPGLADTDVLALARQQNRWLVTFDTDYGELLFSRHLPPPPAVLLLRERHYSPAEPAQWVETLLRSPAELAGSFCVITRNSIRRRPLLRVSGNAD